MHRLTALLISAGLAAGPALAKDASRTTIPAPPGSAALTPQVPEPPAPAGAAATSPDAPFDVDAVERLFESAAAKRPSADDLIGIWVQTARVDENAAEYEPQGIDGARLMNFVSDGNPFAGARTIHVYVDAGQEEAMKRDVSFGERSARFTGYECRQVTGLHLLCRTGYRSFEGFLQTRKGPFH